MELLHIVLILSILANNTCSTEQRNFYEVEGRILATGQRNLRTLIENTEIFLQNNNHIFKGFLKDDGRFYVLQVPTGSYILYVVNPSYEFEQLRLSVNAKGIRAKKVSYIQPNQVPQVEYPLRLRTTRKINYFLKRDQFKMTDFLFSPMVIMMILALVLLFILPKLMSDPDTKKDLDNMQLPGINAEMPDMSEMLSKIMASQSPQQQEAKNKRQNSS